jgi:hypothetical protein
MAADLTTECHFRIPFTGLTIAPLDDENQGSHECRAKDCGGQDRGDRPGLMGSDRPQKHPVAQ